MVKNCIPDIYLFLQLQAVPPSMHYFQQYNEHYLHILLTCVFLFVCLFFFSTFDKDQLANIHRHCWKERVKISKLAKFESDISEASKDIALESREILQTFLWWGVQTCLPPYRRL